MQKRRYYGSFVGENSVNRMTQMTEFVDEDFEKVTISTF